MTSLFNKFTELLAASEPPQIDENFTYSRANERDHLCYVLLKSLEEKNSILENISRIELNNIEIIKTLMSRYETEFKDFPKEHKDSEYFRRRVKNQISVLRRIIMKRDEFIKKYNISPDDVYSKSSQYIVSKYGTEDDKKRYLLPFGDKEGVPEHTAYTTSDNYNLLYCSKFFTIPRPLSVDRDDVWQKFITEYCIFRESKEYNDFSIDRNLRKDEVNVLYGRLDEFENFISEHSKKGYLIYVNYSSNFEPPYYIIPAVGEGMVHTKFEYYGDRKSKMLFISALLKKDTFSKYFPHQKKEGFDIAGKVFIYGRKFDVDLKEGVAEAIDVLSRLDERYVESFGGSMIKALMADISEMTASGMLVGKPASDFESKQEINRDRSLFGPGDGDIRSATDDSDDIGKPSGWD